MKLVLAKVESSNIESLGYNSDTAILAVKFLNSGTYLYAGVPLEIAAPMLTQAFSVGSYFAQNIKGRYKYCKLEGANEEKNKVTTQTQKEKTQGGQAV
jgi:hypothetical protein